MTDVTCNKVKRELYLGDGLYASFDGYSYTLRAPREHGDHYVVLEPWLLALFIEFTKRCGDHEATGK